MLTGVNSRMTGVLSEFLIHCVPMHRTQPLVSPRLDAGYQFPAIDDSIAEEEGYLDTGARDGRLRDCVVGVLADVIMEKAGYVCGWAVGSVSYG
jgi:hypothetical protein